MKKQIKKLNFTKETVSAFSVKQIIGGRANNDGGADKGPQTFLAQGCGTSVNHSACICAPITYFDDSCGSCQY